MFRTDVFHKSGFFSVKGVKIYRASIHPVWQSERFSDPKNETWRKSSCQVIPYQAVHKPCQCYVN